MQVFAYCPIDLAVQLLDFELLQYSPNVEPCAANARFMPPALWGMPPPCSPAGGLGRGHETQRCPPGADIGGPCCAGATGHAGDGTHIPEQFPRLTPGVDRDLAGPAVRLHWRVSVPGSTRDHWQVCAAQGLTGRACHVTPCGCGLVPLLCAVSGVCIDCCDKRG